MIIATDIDGVLVDIEKAWVEHAERILDRALIMIDPKLYYFTKRYSLTKEEHDLVFESFDWSSPPAYDGAIEASIKLNEAGFEVHLVSNTPEHISTVRHYALEAMGFQFDDIHCIGSTTCKSDKLASINSVMFIDDLLSNVAIGDLVGIEHLYHVDRGYSTDSEVEKKLHLDRVNSVSGFATAIDHYLEIKASNENDSIGY